LYETEGSIGLGLVKLIVEPPPTAGEQAKTLIRSTRNQITDEAIQQEILQLIEKKGDWKAVGMCASIAGIWFDFRTDCRCFDLDLETVGRAALER